MTISLLFSVCLTPLFSEEWKEIIHLKLGDYYLLDGTELGDRFCPYNQISMEISEDMGSNFPSNRSEFINCSDNTYFGNFIQPLQTHFKTYIYNSRQMYFENPIFQT